MFDGIDYSNKIFWVSESIFQRDKHFEHQIFCLFIFRVANKIHVSTVLHVETDYIILSQCVNFSSDCIQNNIHVQIVYKWC